LFTASAARIDVASVLRSTTDRGNAHERKVYVRTKTGRMLAGRLCWLRLLPDDARKARAHAKRDGVKDDGELDLCEYIAIFTTADATRINTSQVFELYRARWQIELAFKRDKSLGELDRLPNLIPKTIHAWICGKVLLNLIVQRLSTRKVNVSPSGIADVVLRSPESTANSSHQRRALVRNATGLVDGTRRAPIHHAA
jgi:hypothetical protein